MTSTSTIIAAMRDEDLRERLVATAILLDVPEPQVWVATNLPRLIVADADSSGATTVDSVYEYARANYVPTPRPGENPAAVTDSHLAHAVAKIRAEEVQP